MSDTAGYQGFMDLHSQGSDYNSTAFLVASILAKSNTASLVQIKAVNTGAGTVDVNPMVAQIDGQGNITPHGIVYGLPFIRLQGGTNAIIIDPKAGDIGIAVFAAQDISKVKATKKPGPPGSRRKFDMADGVYIGGLLNATPVQFVRFTDSGIEVTSPAKVTITAPDIELMGDTKVTGTLTATVDVVGNGTHLHTHTHSGVTTGGGTSGPPT